MNLAEILTIPSSMYPEQEIVCFEEERLIYAELEDRVGRTAAALVACGVQPGDRVAVLQTSSAWVIEALYATVSVGGVFVPLNYRARLDELTPMVDLAEPRVLLVGDRYLKLGEALAAHTAGKLQVIEIEGPSAEVEDLQSLAAAQDPIPPVDADDDALAVLLFTSGTSAAAKAVMLSHGDLTNFVFTTTEPIDGTDRGAVLIAAPLYHVAGLSAVLTATFAGRRIVLMRQFEPDEWLGLVGAEGITHAFLVPTMLRRVLDHPSFASADLTSLQVLSYGAAPMPMRLIRRALETFPTAVQFINAFGQTETTSTVTMLGPEDHRLEGSPEEVELKLRRLGSIGRPLPEVDLAILDEAGQPLPAGQVGEIAIRTERTMQGYYRQESATAETLHDGWLHTRDLGWIDEDGYVFLAGRKADLIIRGGENIAPDEIEAVLHLHPAVEEATVIGLPDEEWGERIAAVIVSQPAAEVTAIELIEFCHQRLASYKKPEAVLFVAELPKTSLGKVLRREVRQQYSETLRESYYKDYKDDPLTPTLSL